VFSAFIKVISNFYSCKANVEFTIVCFDGSDVIGWFTSKPGIVWVYATVWKKFSKEDGGGAVHRVEDGRRLIVVVIHEGNKIS